MLEVVASICALWESVAFLDGGCRNLATDLLPKGPPQRRNKSPPILKTVVQLICLIFRKPVDCMCIASYKMFAGWNCK